MRGNVTRRKREQSSERPIHLFAVLIAAAATARARVLEGSIHSSLILTLFHSYVPTLLCTSFVFNIWIYISHLPNHAYALSQRLLCVFWFLFQKTAQNVKIHAERSLADICFLYISYGICIVRDTMVVQLLHFWPVIEEKCKWSEEWSFSFGSLDTTKVAVALFFAVFCMTNCFTFIFFL